MTESIEETLKRLADATSKGSSQNSSTSDEGGDQIGDPECPHCQGVGYLRRDLPLDHPDFGKVEICLCRQPAVRARMQDLLFSLSHLEELRHLTLESFNPQGRVGYTDRERASIERAFNQATIFAENLDGWLLLLGGYGSGKTHLAAAIANRCVSQGIPTLFLTVPDLLDSLRFAFNAEDVTFEERFNDIRNAPMLVLDDFGTQNATAWAREKLFQILNFRYINHLPLVVTTNLSLDEIEGRMRSRLLDPELVSTVEIRAPDYRRPIHETPHHELSSLSLHSQQTFGTFNLRRGEKLPATDQRTLEEAFELARTFSEDPDGWLVLLGPYGSGKTHLAAAIANYQAGLGNDVMFVVVPDLLDHLRATFNPNSPVPYDRRFEEVRSAGLLVLDDLGTQAMTPWVQEKLYQLLNHRYNAALPTVITTADTLDDIDPRLRARMLDQRLCRIRPITVPAYRGGKTKRRPTKR